MGHDRGSPVEHARSIREAILRRHGFSDEAAVPGINQPGALEDAVSLATVNAHWGIASSLPVVGRVVVLVRRAMRIGMRWYINPIVEQQNAFNDATVRALFELQAENDALRAELDQLKRDGIAN
jgi:hypothetical protein